MNPQDVKDYVVVPVLEAIKDFIPFTLSAQNLVLGTAAQESGFYYLDQTTPGPGPAYGIYQMEQRTYDGHVAWLKQKPEFWDLVQEFRIKGLKGSHLELQGNLYYATIMTRVHYYRVNVALPGSSDVSGMAWYWKKFYNTHLGKGTVTEFETNYNRLVKDLK